MDYVKDVDQIVLHVITQTASVVLMDIIIMQELVLLVLEVVKPVMMLLLAEHVNQDTQKLLSHLLVV